MKIVFSLLVCLCAWLPIWADAPKGADSGAITAKEAFLRLKGDPLQLISESTRRDMVLCFEGNQKYTPLNSLRGTCELKALTPSYAMVEVSNASTVQIAILPAGKKQVVAVIYTVDGGDSPDSELLLYDEKLNPLPLGKYFKEPQMQMFMVKGKEAQQAQELVPFLLVSYAFDITGDTPALEAQLNVKGSMSEEDFDRLRPYLSTYTLIYYWDGKRFSAPRPMTDINITE